VDKGEFVNRVHSIEDRMYRIAYGQLHDLTDCMDAVQEAILRAWQGRHRLNNVDFFETWLVRILINECHKIQHTRRRLVPTPAMPEQEYMDCANLELYEAIMELPEKLRMPIILHYLEGYTTEEIASILHVPVGTIRSRLKRGRQLLNTELRDPDQLGGYEL